MMATDADKRRAEELNNSRDLDVHKWSDYPEVNKAVDELYEKFIELPDFKGKQNLQKKHIKVIVLDLYVRYLEDPEGYISFYRMKGMYKGQNRYNKLHISFISVSVIDNLEKLGYIEQTKGHYDRTGSRPSHTARMRATSKLIDLVVNGHSISPKMIEKHPNTECIIMRDEEKWDTLYEDTPDTIALRKDLCAYNNLIRRTHIDVHSYPEEGAFSRSKKKLIKIDRNNKFTRRIYNNNKWNEGGRYYGGWWQRIPKEWREHIRINGSPVVEVDYSGLHIILLYGLEGVDYWTEVGRDPYEIEEFKHLEGMRELLKLLLLTILNAKSKKDAIKAINSEINKDKEKYQWFINEGIKIEDLIDKFSNIHQTIHKYFFNSYGIKLQYIDSRIAERVINQLTQEEIPVLCVHDSFIVPESYKNKLYQLMTDSFNQETPITIPRMTDSYNPFYGDTIFVPYKGNTSLCIEESHADKENEEIDRRLKEHKSIKWSKQYYY